MSEIWNLSTICRCCHSDGQFKSLREPYQVGEHLEIYETMLRDVFAIALVQITTVTFEASYTICNECIQKLKEADRFKRQVLECERRFYVYCKNEQFLIPPVETVVKEEDVFDDRKEQSNEIGDNQVDDKTVVDLKKEYKIEVDVQTEIPTGNTGSYEVTLTAVTSVTAVTDNVNEGQSPPSDNEDSELWEEVKIEKDVKPLINKKVAEKNVPDKETAEVVKIRYGKDKLKEGLKLIQTRPNGKTFTYTCKKCQIKFDNKDSIKKHIFAIHKEVSSYECKLCFKVFLTGNTYASHARLHKTSKKINEKLPEPYRKPDSTTGLYTCEVCKKLFDSGARLNRHMKCHDGTNKVELCELCGRGFNDRANLRIHIRSVHEKLRPFICDICGRTYTAKKHVKAHIIAHMFGRPATKMYQCDKCAKQFKCPKSLKEHQLRHDNKFPCNVCHKIFDGVTAYKLHKHNPAHVKYYCDICNKELSSTYTLKRHIDGHNNVRKFPCDKCTLRFIDKAQLKRHVARLHDPEKPYHRVQCPVCKRMVTNMDKHMPTHDNKKYSCIYCNNSYVENRSLKRHIEAMHFGKVTKCDICNKNVISLKSLIRHKTRVHRIFKSEMYNEYTSEMGSTLNNESEVLDIEFDPTDRVE